MSGLPENIDNCLAFCPNLKESGPEGVSQMCIEADCYGPSVQLMANESWGPNQVVVIECPVLAEYRTVQSVGNEGLTYPALMGGLDRAVVKKRLTQQQLKELPADLKEW